MRKLIINVSIFTFLPIIFYSISLRLTAADTSFSYRWITFALWITACIIPFMFLVIQSWDTKSIINLFNYHKKEFWFFLAIILFAFIFSFSLLQQYPFVALYDQVRDGGLNAMEIVNGTFFNIFGFGRYASHGATIPTITSFFYILFHNSVLTYRVPAALLGVIDTALLFILVRKISGKYSAFFASLTLATLPLHMFYARTEVVVMWSEFFTLCDLLLFYFLTKRKTLFLYILLGISLGFGSGFHTSARTVSIGIGLITMLFSLHDYITNKKFKSLGGIILLILFYFIGYGPRILYTTPEIFFQTRSFALHDSNHSLTSLVNNYWKSLQVYMTEPTYSTHYPDFKPLLTPALSLLFIFGIAISLLSKKLFTYLLIFLTFALPFTNSAITEAVNSDNRLLPLIIMASIFTGIGAGEIVVYARKNLSKIIYFCFLSAGIAYLLLQGFLFFWNEPANKNYGVQDYLSMHTVYTIQTDKQYQALHSFCFFVSPASYQYFNLMHVQEQYEYFVPGKTITVIEKPEIPENQLFVSASCNFSDIQQRSQPIVFCNPTEKFTCPKDSLLVDFVEDPHKVTVTRKPSTFTEPTIIIPPEPAVIP